MIDRKALSASRAAFWADKEANYVNASLAKPGKLELAHNLSAKVANWNTRYHGAKPTLRLINGGSN